MDREINRKLIEKQAREILDKFASALQKVEKEGGEEDYIDREKFEREEKSNDCGANNGFKERILANAPHKDDDFIIAEKGGWK